MIFEHKQHSDQSILVVEDNPLFGSMVCKMIRQQLPIPLVWVKTFTEAQQHIQRNSEQFLVALLDLNLPDAEMGEAVDCAVAHHIPSIVFTSRFSRELHDQIWNKGVVDYVLKEGPDSLNYIVKQIRRLQRNPDIKILVAEDSALIREQLVALLKVQRFQVTEAADGQQALELLNKEGDIKLLLTDYHMPVMDGFELIRKIRRTHSYNELAIIGLSAQDDCALSAKFLKYGANDYIVKPFLREEFYCRIHQNIDLLEQIALIQASAERDFLTGLYNRRYLFRHWNNISNSQHPLALAMVDIDHFKKVNDTYGHDAGDIVLKQVAAVLQRFAGKNTLVARFGGEEFCLLYAAGTPQAEERMNELCREIRTAAVTLSDGNSLTITVSIGLCCACSDNIDEMIKTADSNLYRAKEGGRDRVVCI